MLSLACKCAAILEVNKQMMKTITIQKLGWTNYVMKVYKNRDCLGRSRINYCFLRVQKKNLQSAHFFDGREIGNNIFFTPYMKSMPWFF